MRRRATEIGPGRNEGKTRGRLGILAWRRGPGFANLLVAVALMSAAARPAVSGCSPEMVAVWYPGGSTAVEVSAGHALVGNGSELLVLDVPVAGRPHVTARLPLRSQPMAISVSGRHAYVALQYLGMSVVDVSDPEAPVEVGWFAPPELGLVTAIDVSDGIAYLARGPGPLAVVNVKDPTRPVQVGSWNGGGWATSVDVSGDYAYVIAGNLFVLDVSDPSAPVPMYFAPGSRCTPVAIAVSGSHAYVAGDESFDVFDISDPGVPLWVGGYSIGGFAFPSDIVVSDHHVYVTRGGLSVIDVSDPTAPTPVGGYPGSATDVAVEGHWAYLTDSVVGFLVLDVSVPPEPELWGSCDLPQEVETYSPGDIALSGPYTYASFYDTVGIVEISDPAHPRTVGFIDTPGFAGHLAVEGGHLYVVQGGGGLTVVDVTDPEHPVKAGFCNSPGNPQAIAAAGGYAYVVDYNSGLRLFDIRDPARPVEVGWYDTPGHATDVAASGGHAFIADGDAGLRVINVENPKAPFEVGSLAGSMGSVAVSGDYAYLTGSDGLHVVDVAIPATPLQVGFLQVNELVDVAVYAGHVYATVYSGLLVVDVSDPASPVAVGGAYSPGPVRNLAVGGGHAYLVNHDHGELDVFALCEQPTDGFERGDTSARPNTHP